MQNKKVNIAKSDHYCGKRKINMSFEFTGHWYIILLFFNLGFIVASVKWIDNDVDDWELL